MPALARVLRLALRAGFRKPSGEEAAVGVSGVSGYGDSACRCPAGGGRVGPGSGQGQQETATISVRRWLKRQCWRLLIAAWAAAGRKAQRALRQDPGAMAGADVAEGRGRAHELSHQTGPRGRVRQASPRPMTWMIRRPPPQHGQIRPGAAFGSPGSGACSGAAAGCVARFRIRARRASRGTCWSPWPAGHSGGCGGNRAAKRGSGTAG